MRFRYSIMAAILLLSLSLIDATCTAINIDKWGMDVEWNPLMRHLIEEYGIWVMFFMKGVFGVLLIAMLWVTPEERVRKWVTPLMMWMVGAYSVIVFYGYILLTT
jgi:hypothetical protein